LLLFVFLVAVCGYLLFLVPFSLVLRVFSGLLLAARELFVRRLASVVIDEQVAIEDLHGHIFSVTEINYKLIIK